LVYGKNKSITLKVKNYHLTGVKKILVGCDLTVKFVKIWVETIDCGPAPRCPVKYLPG
jgi:hypothetical protein